MPSPGSPLHAFVRDNERWLCYALNHPKGFDVKRLAVGARDSATLQRRFASRLERDTTFNALVLPAVVADVQQHGVTVVDALPPRTRPVIAIDDVIQTAARFFYPDIITPTGILTHVCTVINAVKELGPRRNLALEAVVFSAIMTDIRRGDSSYVEPDFGPTRKLMNRLDVRSQPKSVRLDRERGVIWGAMTQRSRLRDVLMRESAAKADFLPFVIAPSS